MSWKQYVEHHMQGRTQVALASLVEVSPGAISRWLSGTQGVNAAVAISFARKVGDSPLQALIAAGHLVPAEAEHVVNLAPDYSQLSVDELLELLRDRIREEVMGNAKHPAPIGGAEPECSAEDVDAEEVTPPSSAAEPDRARRADRTK